MKPIQELYSQSRKELVWLSRNRKFSSYDLVTFRRHLRQPFNPSVNTTFQVTQILEKVFVGASYHDESVTQNIA